MKKITKIQIALLALLLIILVVIKHSIPKPLNWDKTYEYVDKIPYGCSGLYSVLKDLFPAGKISVNRFSYYRYFRDKSLPNTSTIIITDKFSPDTTDRKALLDQVALGNNLFIAASDIDNKMCHLLGIKLQTTGFDLNPFTKGEKKVVFTDKELKKCGGFSTENLNDYIDSIDNSNTEVLARGAANNSMYFIKVHYGDGYVFVNLIPEAFTNYHFIYLKNDRFASTCLSYLPVNSDVIWDEYYKPYSSSYQTPLRYILSSPALRAAYILLVFSLLVYIFFTARRKQRIVAVIKPLRNTSLDFVETIGRLYFHKSNHRDIALKRFSYLTEWIRTNRGINTAHIDDEFYTILSARTGIDRDRIVNLFNVAAGISAKTAITKENLIEFNRLIEEFYNNVKKS
jgi:hypothetical protein